VERKTARLTLLIDPRKKKLFEPKSLPDMVKLAKSVRGMVDEVGGLKTQSIADVVKTKVTPGDFEKTFWADLDRELKKSLSVRANAAATLLLEKFKPRLMKLRGDSVVTLTKETIELCAKAEAAHKKGQDRLAKISIQAAIGKADEVHGIVSGYSEAYNKNKSFLKGNPDHDTMLKFVSALTTKENQALKAVEATQKALK